MSSGKRSVVITPYFDAFIDAQVATGRFNNASEVVRAGLRLLEREESKFAELRASIQHADQQIANGEFREFSLDGDLMDYIVERAKSDR